ncbi:hypothetical protein HU200_054098 [Digitaria exilis]|uniref:Pentatricopeptide repeat-containing protein n=1 Tax=Digitaria exilis TaxID=1010633 RepID=A0A835E2T6_9POAL|nr:hypothetical protein HU200_054098 [Digitaria exilis]
MNSMTEVELVTMHQQDLQHQHARITCAAVLAALLCAHRLEFFALHRFTLQAAVPPTATPVLYLFALAACRLPDNALHHLRLLARPGSPVPPSPATYRVVVKCLVADHGRFTDVILLKDEMLDSGFVGPDPKVYNLLMAGFMGADGAKAVGCGFVRFGAESYNEVVDALGQNGKLEDALKMFDRMLKEHDRHRLHLRARQGLNEWNIQNVWMHGTKLLGQGFKCGYYGFVNHGGGAIWLRDNLGAIVGEVRQCNSVPRAVRDAISPVHGLVSRVSGLLPDQPRRNLLVRCGLDLFGLCGC